MNKTGEGKRKVVPLHGIKVYREAEVQFHTHTHTHTHIIPALNKIQWSASRNGRFTLDKVDLLPIQVSATIAQLDIFLMGIELRTSQFAARLLYRLQESGCYGLVGPMFSETSRPFQRPKKASHTRWLTAFFPGSKVGAA